MGECEERIFRDYVKATDDQGKIKEIRDCVRFAHTNCMGVDAVGIVSIGMKRGFF